MSVYPGRTLLIVMQGCNSLERDLLQLAMAPRRVFERPIPSTGSFTEVEIMFTILPNQFPPSRDKPLHEKMGCIQMSSEGRIEVSD